MENNNLLNRLKLFNPIREIKGKRAVYFTKYSNRDVVVKTFFRKKDYLKELSGSLLLKGSSIKSPDLISFGKDSKLFYIVFSKLNDSIDIQEFITRKDIDLVKKKLVIEELLESNKKLINSNIVQEDNYLKNYLYVNGSIHFIDGGRVKKISKIQFIKKIKNFALICSKIPPELQPSNNYLYANNLARMLHNYFVSYYIYRSICKFQKKSLRNSSDFIHISKSTELLLGRKNFSFDLKKLDDLPSDGQIIKDGNTCTVFRYKSFVIKKYNIKSFFHFFSRQFKKSRGLRSWQISNVFQLVNLPCPTPIFFYEKRFLFLKLESYFVSEFIDGEDLMTYSDNHENDRKVLAKSLDSSFRKFSYYRFAHGDLKATNILVNLPSKKIFFVDFDKSYFYRYQNIYNYVIQKQIKRFFLNWKTSSKFVLMLKKTFKENK